MVVSRTVEVNTNTQTLPQHLDLIGLRWDPDSRVFKCFASDFKCAAGAENQ